MKTISNAAKFTMIALAAMTTAGTTLIPSIARADDTAPTTKPTETSETTITATVTGDEVTVVGQPLESLKLQGQAMPGFRFATRVSKPMVMEKGAFLGVGASGVDSALRAQLELPKGVGLTVSYVEDGGPAAKAGVQQHDIIQKLNDQLIINTPQFSTLVRTFKPGDTVTLTVIRKGKPVELKATLIERDLPPLADASDAFTVNFTTPDAPIPPRVEDRIMRLREFQGQAPDTRADVVVEGQVNKGPRIIRLSPGSSRQIMRSDDEHSIQLQQQGEKTTLNVKDKDGNVLFDGPYNTPEEKEKLPAELREKVKKMDEGFEIKPIFPTTNPSEPKAEADSEIERVLKSQGLST